MSEKTPKGMVLSGPFASEALDSSGEVLSVDGCDISDFEEGKGVVNFEHRDDATEIVGKVLTAKKIYGLKDCSDEFQREAWAKIKVPFIWGTVRLFDAAGSPAAVALAASIRDQVGNKERVLLGWSIEGSTLEKEGNKLKESVARRVALTYKACNKTCHITRIVSDPGAPEGFSTNPESAPKDILSDIGEEAKKFEHPMYTKLGGSVEFEYDDPEHKPLDKALTAGGGNAAPSTLTGGAALAKEDLKRKLVDLISKYDRPFDKAEFRSFLKTSMPEASDEYLDHFTSIAEEHHRVRLHKDEAALPAKTKKAAGPKPAKAPEIKAQKPAKEPKLPKKAAEPNEDDEDSIVDLKQGTIRGVPVEPIKMRGYKFDEDRGILHTPKGSFPLYNPDQGFGIAKSNVPAPTYKDGVLHIPHNVDESTVPANPPNPKFREIYLSEPIEKFHSEKVMPQWTKVHGLLKAGKLPEEVVVHSAHFSMMSPNTPVRPHELMHSHAVDAWEDHGVDPRDPDYAKTVGADWLKRDQPKNYPRLAREYFQTHPDVHLGSDSELTGRKAGDISAFMLANNKLANVAKYHQLHNTLMGIVQRHGVDSRSATKELMDLKHQHNLWKTKRQNVKKDAKDRIGLEQGLKDDYDNHIKSRMAEGKVFPKGSKEHYDKLKKAKAEAKQLGLKNNLSDAAEAEVAKHPEYGQYKGVVVPGLAPKTGRFTFSMIGGGNTFVPDTHITRHLFGMDAGKDGDTLAYLKSVLWNAKNSHILDGIDRWYSKNHPAAQEMANHPTWKEHFTNQQGKPDAEQAVFPAFWRHWCSIAEDERQRGMQNTASNEFSTHEPFWLGIRPHVDKVAKGEDVNHDFIAKLATVMQQYVQDYGEIPAQMLYFIHLVPELLEESERRQSTSGMGFLLKTAKLHATELKLRKAVDDAKAAPATNPEVEEPTIHSIHLSIDGKTHPAGRYIIHNGNLTHLEDYHGLLNQFLPEGPVNLKTISRIHGLEAAPYLHIHHDELPKEAQPDSDDQVGMEEIQPEQAPMPVTRRPSVFDYHRVGHDRPHALEVKDGTVLLDGNPLTRDEVGVIMGNVRNGLGTLRYRHSKVGEMVQKAESAFAGLLMKAEGYDPGDALQYFRNKHGNDPEAQEHLKALTRHVYEDPMVGGVGNKYAFEKFRQQNRPGVWVSLDGNDFSNVNNAYGHATGDSAIKSMGRALRESVDEVGNGKAFRSGGDEMVVHFPTHEHAAKFARTLSQKLDTIPPVNGEHKLSMGMGFGNDYETADKALSMAKQQKYHPGQEHLPDRMKQRKFPMGQAPSFAHSLVPGFEGAVPTHDAGATAIQHTLTPPKIVSKPEDSAKLAAKAPEIPKQPKSAPGPIA